MSEQLVTATVEIFYDKAYEQSDISQVFDGINIVSAIAGRLDILDATRPITLGRDTDNRITTESASWPEFAADINVIVTPDMFAARSNNPSPNSSVRGIALGDIPAVLVNTQEPSLVTTTVAHELGHVFGVKAMGRFLAMDNVHCALYGCIMFPEQTLYVASDGSANSLLNDIMPCEFCSECLQQLSHIGTTMAHKKAGLDPPQVSTPLRRRRNIDK